MIQNSQSFYNLVNFIGNKQTWYLETRPSTKYISLRKSAIISCYNITNTTITLPHDSQWYKITLNGTLQELSTNTSERVRSDGSQLRISSAIREDGGSYCCKGLMQKLDSCDESATVNINITILPVIIPGPHQTVLAGGNATVECIIENEGSPPFLLQRWQKSGQRLVIDGTKYISSPPNSTIMLLTIVNSSAEDVGRYECILETVTFEIKQAFVNLSLNHTGRSHTGVSYVVITCNIHML